MRVFRFLPSPALVVAALALLVALGGTAYAVVPNAKGGYVSTLAGCPYGTRLFTAVCVEPALRGGNKNWGDSATVCKRLARRLPTVAELWLFRNQPGITLGGAPARSEWALDIVDASHHVSVNDAGDNSLSVNTTPLPYRCVAAPGS